MGREDEALRELVANWHCLTPSVKTTIMDFARSGSILGRGLEALSGPFHKWRRRLTAFGLANLRGWEMRRSPF